MCKPARTRSANARTNAAAARPEPRPTIWPSEMKSKARAAASCGVGESRFMELIVAVWTGGEQGGSRGDVESRSGLRWGGNKHGRSRSILPASSGASLLAIRARFGRFVELPIKCLLPPARIARILYTLAYGAQMRSFRAVKRANRSLPTILSQYNCGRLAGPLRDPSANFERRQLKEHRTRRARGSEPIPRACAPELTGFSRSFGMLASQPSGFDFRGFILDVWSLADCWMTAVPTTNRGSGPMTSASGAAAKAAAGKAGDKTADKSQKTAGKPSAATAAAPESRCRNTNRAAPAAIRANPALRRLRSRNSPAFSTVSEKFQAHPWPDPALRKGWRPAGRDQPEPFEQGFHRRGVDRPRHRRRDAVGRHDWGANRCGKSARSTIRFKSSSGMCASRAAKGSPEARARQLCLHRQHSLQPADHDDQPRRRLCRQSSIRCS